MSELAEHLKPLLAELVEQISDATAEDAAKYAGPVSEDCAQFLMRAYVEGDETAHKELKLLKTQVKLLALKHLGGAQNDIAEFVAQALKTAIEIAVITLRTLK
jgi:hypothetical protein